MEKRKFDLVKQNIVASDEEMQIADTIYYYKAYPAKLKIINSITTQITTFNGKFCDKQVMFKIDKEH